MTTVSTVLPADACTLLALGVAGTAAFKELSRSDRWLVALWLHTAGPGFADTAHSPCAAALSGWLVLRWCTVQPGWHAQGPY